MMDKNRKVVVGLAVAWACAIHMASATWCQPREFGEWIRLDEIGTAGLTVGDNLFDNFSIASTTTGSAYAPEDVWVRGTAYQQEEQIVYGLGFKALWTASPLWNAGTAQSTINYTVAVLDPNHQMVGHQLQVVPGNWRVWGDGSIAIDNQVGNDSFTGDPLGIHKNRGSADAFDEAALLPPQTFLEVVNEITLSASSNGGCWCYGDNGAMLFQFDNIFVQETIPEPATASMLAVGSIFLISIRRRMGGFRLRNRRRQTNGYTSCIVNSLCAKSVF